MIIQGMISQIELSSEDTGFQIFSVESRNDKRVDQHLKQPPMFLAA